MITAARHFDPLRRTKKKGKGMPEKKKLEDHFTSHKDLYTYIPRKAFSHLMKYDPYSYLGSGLFVCQEKLRADPDIRARCHPQISLSTIDDGETITDVGWLNAKKIQQDMGATQLSPAEYFATKKYLEETGLDDKLLNDMTLVGEEFLDANIRYAFVISLKPEIGIEGTVDGTLKYLKTVFHKGGFNTDELQDETGMPYKLHEDGEFRSFSLRGPFNNLLRTTEYYDGKDKPCVASYSIGFRHSDCGLRLCYPGKGRIGDDQ